MPEVRLWHRGFAPGQTPDACLAARAIRPRLEDFCPAYFAQGVCDVQSPVQISGPAPAPPHASTNISTKARGLVVDVYEHEKGWGQRLEDHHTFTSLAQAESFWQQANAQFALHGDAECYALAHPPYRKKDDC